MKHVTIILLLCAFLSGTAFSSTNALTDKKNARPVANDKTTGIEQAKLKTISEKISQFRNAPKAAKRQKNTINYQLPTAQKQALIELIRDPNRNIQIEWSQDGSSPIFIEAENLLSDEMSGNTINQSLNAFAPRAKRLLGLENQDDKLVFVKQQTDALGMTHVRMHQSFANVPVYGRDLYYHFDKDNKLVGINGRTTPLPKSLDIQPSVTARNAEIQAIQYLGLKDTDSVPVQSRLVIYPMQDEFPLTYIVNVKPTLAENWDIVIDAHSGNVLKKINRICYDGAVNASGMDLQGNTRNFSSYQLGSDHYLIDTSKPMFNAGQSQIPDNVVGGIVVLDAQNGDGSQLYYNTSTNANSWSVPNAISAIANGGVVYDYYRNIHNRNSIDGNGGTMYIVVNFDNNYNNAFWNGQFMVFGNGDNQQFSDLAGALDVTAHEMSHGVIEHTANLIYEEQSGALNESFADVFGVAAEFYHEGANGDWLVGEDVTTPSVANDALRDMIQPDGPNVGGGLQPGHMNQYQTLPNTEDGDNGGVHVNSGIPNRAFYLVANTVGVEKAEQIYYRALSVYLTRSSQFIDARIAILKSASDLYGENSTEYQAVQSAFNTVGILDGEGSTLPDIEPQVQGVDWILAVDSGTRALYRISLDAETIEMISASPVLNKPSVTDDGEFVLFVDYDYNPRIVAIDGSAEQQLDDSGTFWNLAYSPNGNYIAATSNVADGLIYLFDMVNTDNVYQYPLYAQTYTEGAQSSTVLYADAMDWTLDSQYLVYDAYNIAATATGDTLDYWDINFLRIADGTVIRAFPPQDIGVNLGNPVLASNNDYIMAFDFVDANGEVTAYGANLETGDVGVITRNGYAISRPDFSSDDSAVIYEYTDGNNYGVFVTSLLDDGITGAGDDFQFLSGAIYPLWVTRGTRPETAVEENDIKIPSALTLHQNYPNPFNPETTIRFDLPENMNVRLDVYNVLGRNVMSVADGFYTAGSHQIKFNGQDLPSGIYYYRLTTPMGTETQKMLLLK